MRRPEFALALVVYEPGGRGLPIGESPPCSMLVPMMDVGEVPVTVRDRQMPVAVTVRFLARPASTVFVLVVLVVAVAVRVQQVGMGMLMSVLLAEMQPDADGHQCRGCPERQ